MRRLVAVLIVALVFGAAGCGGSKSSSSSGNGTPSTTQAGGGPAKKIRFAKTKFVLHAGLAFGAFHRYLYKPLKAGAFRKGASGRVKAFLKGAAAALFTVHEVRIALKDARSSKLLSKLVSPLTALQDRFAALRGRLKGGSTDPSAEIASLNGQVERVRGQSSSLGAPIKDRTAPIPGT